MTSGREPGACYLHIPFCARVCPYCDFAVVAGRDTDSDRYLAALRREIASDRPAGPLVAVFIGGGTPSSVPVGMIERLLADLESRHGIAPGAEVSIESNPEDLGGGKLSSLSSAGVNRLSIGGQSYDPAVLAALGRVHAPDDITAAVEGARRAGITSVSIDLIFGHPSETGASWRKTLATTIAAAPDHISTYALTIERGTPFSRAIAGGAPAPDEDIQADRYEAALDLLGSAGYRHYEVSNHARPGHECRYNLAVWRNESYLAYGLGAHGYRDGVRHRNVRALDAYLGRSEGGRSVRQGEEHITGWDVELERLMLGLRLREGVPAGVGGAALANTPGGVRLLRAGIMSMTDDQLRVERPLFTDAVIREVLALPAPGE